MRDQTRREFFELALAAPAGLASASTLAARPERASVDIHQQILELAARHEDTRRARFLAVKSRSQLESLQTSLRASFLQLLDGLPAAPGPLAVQKTGMIEAEDYLIEKLVFESFPGYFVPALLYKPKKLGARVPGVLSPCGHSTVGKAAGPYQVLHINLAKRGYVVLTYDPVGQGERSQYWDATRRRSLFNLSCGEHAVLGNPLYLLGTSLARYRIWDGIRGLDYLASLPEVDATRIGCVGNSGGGTLTSYIAALDRRVTAAAIGCYITTLRRRMGNRIQQDPSADPEQDLFGFVSEGIDHAGLLAMMAPRPTLLCTARFDFFPIEGARETFDEARRLYEMAGAGDRISRFEAPEKHGLTAPQRRAIYAWFDRWLLDRADPGSSAAPEFAVKPRAPLQLQVCATGQVGLTFRSRPLLPLAFEEFEKKPKPKGMPLQELLNLDFDLASPHISELAAGSNGNQTMVVCINDNETRDWRAETEFLGELRRRNFAVVVVDPRGVGSQRLAMAVADHAYCDPLDGVEENIAYNAFLVGKSLLGMRTTDVLATVRNLKKERDGRRMVLCARRGSALAACFAAAVEPSIDRVATEEMLTSFLPLFRAEPFPINAASILPGLLQRFGDMPRVLSEIAPRRVLIAAGLNAVVLDKSFVQVAVEPFSKVPRILTDWLVEAKSAG